MSKAKIPVSLRGAGRPRHETMVAAAVGLAISGAAGAASAQSGPSEMPQAEAVRSETAQSSGSPVEMAPIAVEGERPDNYKVEQPSSPKYTQPLLDTPQSITIVPQALIEERGATSLKDALRNVTGISLMAGEGGGAQGDNFRIRGFAANNDMFINGVRDIAQYGRDPFNLEQIEVVKGPASTFTGRGSTGGSINLVTKTPRLDPFTAGTFSLGTDNLKRATVDLNQPLTGLGIPGAAIRLNVLGHDSEIAERDVVEDKRWGFAPSLALGLGTDTRFTLSYVHFEEDNIPDYGLPLTNGKPTDGTRRSNWYGFRDVNTEETDSDSVMGELEHDFSGWLTGRTQFSYTVNDRDSIICAPRAGGTRPPGIVQCGPFTGRDSRNSQWVSQSDLTATFDTGILSHSLVGGVEFGEETFKTQSLSFAFPAPPSFDITNPDPDGPFDGVRSRGNLTDSSADTLAFYLFDTVQIGERFEISGGLRYDDFDAKTKRTTPDGVVERASRDDDFLSWRVGGVFKPVPYGSFYAAVGTSFNPSAEGGSLSTTNNTALLKPEETTNYEIGTKWDLFERRLSLTGALFWTEKDNARTTNQVTGEQELAGNQRVRGIEVGAVGRITDAWQIFAGYTYLDSKIVDSLNPAEKGNPVGRTPAHTASLWMTYDFPWGVQVGAGAQYVSDMTVSNSNTHHLQGFVLFDAMASYRLTENVDVRLNIYNITDEFYIEEAHGGGGHGVPGAGRSAVLSTSFRF